MPPAAPPHKFRQRHRNGGKDEYFTHPAIAAALVDTLAQHIAIPPHTQFIEPAAGAGAFLAPLQKLSPHLIAYDIAPPPHIPFIRGRDFLALDLAAENIRDAVFVGNPPFGFAGNLALRFFNKAAPHASHIAFILPRTFKKPGAQAKLNPFFHLLHQSDLPPRAFIVGDRAHTVPSIFQIWQRRLFRRRPSPPPRHHLEFTTAAEAQFAIRRVGGNAGKIFERDLATLNPNSTYFCREKTRGALAVLKKLDFSPLVQNTVGPKSLGKQELAIELAKHLNPSPTPPPPNRAADSA